MTPDAPRNTTDRLTVGRLLAHGQAPHEFRPRAEVSYFVRLQTERGERTLWSPGLKRALTESRTQPKVGDQIGVKENGIDPVSVVTRKKDAEGRITSERRYDAPRTHWVVEKREFFDERAAAARALRDPRMHPREALRDQGRNAGNSLVSNRVTHMALTDTSIRAARAKEKPYKLTDDGGLILLVNLNGSKWWRLRYRFDGREKMLSLGVYPAVPLKRARERRDEIRRQVADGIDPSVKRRSEKFARAYTFEAVALEWLELHRQQLAPVTFAKKRALFEDFIFPYIGQRPIARILAAALLTVLKRIEAREIHETAHRARSQCGAVFRFAVSTGRAERDPTSDLRGARAPVVTTNHPAITEPGRIDVTKKALPLVRELASRYALEFTILTAARSSEVVGTLWSEIDLDAAEWRIPAERMKMKEQHVVPLALQAVELLRNLHPLTASGRYVFPSVRTPARPISENTVNAALRRLGYSKEEMTGHGFRAMAATCLNEQGWHPDLIELQLAHAERDEIRGAHNRAQRLAERRNMMQAWADYLDGLRVSTNVLPTKLAA